MKSLLVAGAAAGTILVLAGMALIAFGHGVGFIVLTFGFFFAWWCADEAVNG